MNFKWLKMVTGETLHTIHFGAFSMFMVSGGSCSERAHESNILCDCTKWQVKSPFTLSPSLNTVM